MGIKGAISAGHQLTAEAGKIMFELGGNAFDAVTAGVLASFVVESALASAGGGGFLLAHTHQGKNFLFDFFCQTPQKKRSFSEVDFYGVEVDFGVQKQVFHIGLGSIAIPGSLAGIIQVHQRLGRLPLAVVAEPSIEYAEKGFEINSFQSFVFSLLEPIFLNTPESRAIYAPRGRLLRAGERCFMRDFARTLRHLIKRGVEDLYQGELAHLLIKDCQDKGGYLTLADLQGYQVVDRPPLQINYREHQLLTNPSPSSGGILIAFALKLLESIPFSQINWRSGEHLTILSQAMALTNNARKQGYDQHIYDPNIIDKFLSQEFLKPYKNQLINRSSACNKLGSTTHISVMDSEGNTASVTTSNGEGSSYIIPDTGIMLNNMLGEEDLNPFGFHQWSCNQRISSMMSPTIVLKNNRPEVALGSGGSNRIRTAILQVISNLIDFKMSIEQAINAPRIHWENHCLGIEPPYDINDLVQVNLPSNTETIIWKEQNMFFGGVHGVIKTNDTLIQGAGDQRRSGICLQVK